MPSGSPLRVSRCGAPCACRSFLHTCTVRANCCAKCHEQLALPTASRTPPELAALTRLQRLQELHIHWPNDPLGPFLPQEWLQPGVWPELNRCGGAAWGGMTRHGTWLPASCTAVGQARCAGHNHSMSRPLPCIQPHFGSKHARVRAPAARHSARGAAVAALAGGFAKAWVGTQADTLGG